MFPVIETVVFVVMAFFLFGFGMCLMRRLDGYIGEQSHREMQEKSKKENL